MVYAAFLAFLGTRKVCVLREDLPDQQISLLTTFLFLQTFLPTFLRFCQTYTFIVFTFFFVFILFLILKCFQIVFLYLLFLL